MASEGPNNPGTMADDAAVGNAAWNNVNNAKTSDGNYANSDTMGPGSITHYLKATNFGFAIPVGATIDGIVVEVERFSSVASVQDYDIKIVKSDGSIGAEDKATAVNWATADPDTYVTYGANNDLWSEAWASADINHANFGVVVSCYRISGLGVVANVDHIRMTVYYTEAPAGTNMQVNISDVLKDVDSMQINISSALKDVTQVKQNIGGVLKDVFG